MTPTQRTLGELRKWVEHVAIVEKWNSHCRIRQDLFGFADLSSFDREDVHLWQVTAGAVAARVALVRVAASPAIRRRVAKAEAARSQGRSVASAHRAHVVVRRETAMDTTRA